MDADDPMMPSDYEDKAPVEMKRCTAASGSSWRCPRMFPVTDKHKTCPHHREISRRCAARPEAKARQKELQKKPSYVQKSKERTDKRNKTPEHKALVLEYHRSEHGKANRRKRQRSEKYVAKKKEWKANNIEKVRGYSRKHHKKPLSKLAGLLWHMSKGYKTESLIRMGCFKSNEHVREHFESTWEPWMSWENHGRRRSVDGYKVAWHFGHKLPCAIFDGSNPNDRRKCFMPMNLFAQDAKDNNKALHMLILSDDELLALRPCWPDAAKGSLVLLKALFSGAAAKAVAEGSSDDEAYLEEAAMAAAETEEEDSGAETEEEATAAGSAAAGSAAGSAAAATAAG
jgi:hypothetical protein